MPLPLIPVVIALVACGGTGIGFGVNGGNAMMRAKNTADEAQEKLRLKTDWYKAEEEAIGREAQEYGRLQCGVQAETLGAWLEWLEANRRKIRKLERTYVDGVRVEVPDIPDLRLRVVEASGLIEGGLSAAMAAIAAQQAALFGVRSLAVAGTGAAISGLSGAAAESATLAWLGGGTLAAGGGGVAAGTAVLSGFAIAPALLIGGITLSIQGEKALTQAKEYATQVDVACEEMDAKVALFEALRVRISEMRGITKSLNRRAKRALAELSQLDFDPDLHAEQFQKTALLMRALGEVLSTPLLDSDGLLSDESFEIVERYAA